MQACALEIYNESVRDLFNSDLMPSGNASKKKFGVHYHFISFDDITKLWTVLDITIINVRNENDLQNLIENSLKRRSIAPTKANNAGSSSNFIFRLRIIRRNLETGE